MCKLTLSVQTIDVRPQTNVSCTISTNLYSHCDRTVIVTLEIMMSATSKHQTTLIFFFFFIISIFSYRGICEDD